MLVSVSSRLVLPSPFPWRVGIHDFAFRGLLKLHSRYGLQGCSPTLQWTLSRGFDPPQSPDRAAR